MENADGNSITTSGIPAEDRYGHELIEKFDNGLREMPQEYRGKFFNACTDPCDMLIGPCACGAWHHLKDWQGKIEPVEKSNKVKPLAQYLDEYIEHEWENNNIDSRLYAHSSWRELLEQALDAYESTENVKIKIEKQ